MIAPMADPCQRGEAPKRFVPSRVITMIGTPSGASTTEPHPPWSLAPPMTTAPKASSSSRFPAGGGPRDLRRRERHRDRA